MDAPSHARARRAGDRETALTDSDRLQLRVWLRLLTCTNLMEGRVRQALHQSFGVTLPRFDVLAQLERAPEGLTMGALSRRLMVSGGNVTGLVDRLVEEGLVERRPVPGDRRAQIVRLSEAGKQSFGAMLPRHRRWIEDMLSGLNREEMATLLALLAKLKASLENQADGGNRT